MEVLTPIAEPVLTTEGRGSFTTPFLKVQTNDGIRYFLPAFLQETGPRQIDYGSGEGGAPAYGPDPNDHTPVGVAETPWVNFSDNTYWIPQVEKLFKVSAEALRSVVEKITGESPALASGRKYAGTGWLTTAPPPVRTWQRQRDETAWEAFTGTGMAAPDSDYPMFAPRMSPAKFATAIFGATDIGADFSSAMNDAVSGIQNYFNAGGSAVDESGIIDWANSGNSFTEDWSAGYFGDGPITIPDNSIYPVGVPDSVYTGYKIDVPVINAPTGLMDRALSAVGSFLGGAMNYRAVAGPRTIANPYLSRSNILNPYPQNGYNDFTPTPPVPWGLILLGVGFLIVLFGVLGRK